MKSGFVSIVGRPNVGKSTLLNHILNHKISIVSDKSQTTRNNIKGIYNDKDSQIIFVDTPGIHKPHQKLGEEMNNMAINSVNDVDAVILVVDVSQPFGTGDLYLTETLKDLTVPLIICYNKIDLAHLDKATKVKDKYLGIYPNAKTIDIIAKDGFNVDEVISLIKGVINEGPAYYDRDLLTDQDEVFQIKEIIREKTLKILSDEVPHSIAVYMENIEWEENPVPIEASIIVEKESQKPIVIGANGKRIKQIGMAARQPIEALLKKHVYLHLLVKVNEDWRNQDKALENYGYKTKKEK